MKDAQGTWAIVVGIDAYDSFKPLTGAVADAAATVRWLRRLGVPDGQIMLHAAPAAGSKATADAIGLPYAGCTENEIWPSFKRLKDNEGERLFVFLSGHGFYEPGGHRLFLTKEAQAGEVTNLWVEWCCEYLRGLPYRRQFVVLDGCLNLPYTPAQRAEIEPGKHSGVKPAAERLDVEQWLCTAASAGQRAMEAEGGGSGLFLPALLAALDLDRPGEFCTAIDRATGAVEYDLRAAVATVAGPIVADLARRMTPKREQHPAITAMHKGDTGGRVPVVTKVPDGTATVRVLVEPPEAEADVKRIRLSSDDIVWDSVVPMPPAVSVTCPVENVLPDGMQVSVRCTMASPDWAQPPQQELVATGERNVVFRLERAGEAAEVAVKTVGADGDVVFGMNSDAYAEVESITGGEGLGYQDYESGPVLEGPDPAKLRSVALRLARRVTTATGAGVSAVVRGVDVRDVRTTVTFEGDARALAGVLADEPVVHVAGTAYPAAGLGEVEVEPGLVPVHVTLPWGRWSTTVRVSEGEHVTVTLPESVGRAPMRVPMLADDARNAPGRTVVTAGAEALTGAVVPVRGTGEAGRIEPAPHLTHWAGPMSAATSEAGPWRAVAAFGPWRTPLSETGTLAVDLGDEPRAEPLSTNRSPDWDALVASGRLEDVSVEAAKRLTEQKWFDSLLGLAGAYACWARGHDEYLDVVLGNLARLDDALPDVPLLAGAADRRRGTERPEVRERLEALDADGCVPLFRWGVSAGVLAAEHYGFGALAADLRGIDATLAPSSVWTLWRV